MKAINTTTKSTFRTVIVFYLLIAFEFFYMASPFAAYFYGLYKPCLGLIDRFPSISWITGFFLPHLVEDTNSVLLNSLKSIGAIIAAMGFVTFLVCAFQIYYARFFKKGMVSGGLYKFIRHPQYTAFAVCSFGLMLLWPRFLVLYMFITLMFTYYLLAKLEEKECEKRFGDNYLQYKNRTYMFLPFFKFPFPKKFKGLWIMLLYIAILIPVLQLSKHLKFSSIETLYSATENNTTYISIFKIEDHQLNKMIDLVSKSEEVKKLLARQTNKGDRLISYILPVDMYISEIPMIVPDNESCHVNNRGYSSDYKVVFTKAMMRSNQNVDMHHVLYNTTHLSPLFEIRIDKNTDKIIKITELQASAIKYKNIPEPIF